MSEWVVVAEYTTEAQARVVAGMLCDNDIEAIVGSSHMTTLYGAGATWAPVTVSVEASQVQKALLLLRQHGD